MDAKQFVAYINTFAPLPDETNEKLWQFFDVFQKEANKLNLTGLKTEEERVIKLLLDSLAPLAFFDFSKVTHAADLGTGGGFPGLPLAIVFPHIQWTLIDSTSKKIDAVSRMTHELELPNVEALWSRSEDLAKEKKQFEVVTTKAFAHFVPMLELSLPLVEKGGHLLAYVGPNEGITGTEVQHALDTHGAEFESTHNYELPQFGPRQLVIFTRHR